MSVTRATCFAALISFLLSPYVQGSNHPPYIRTQFHDLTNRLTGQTFFILAKTNQNGVESRDYAAKISGVLREIGLTDTVLDQADYLVLFEYGQFNPVSVQKSRPVYADIGGGISTLNGYVSTSRGFGTFSGTVSTPSREVVVGYRTEERLVGGGHLRIEIYDGAAFRADQALQRYDGRMRWVCSDCLFHESLRIAIDLLLQGFPGESGKEEEVRYDPGKAEHEKSNMPIQTAITSEPQGVRIEVNGKMIGVTPLLYTFPQDGGHRFNKDVVVTAIPTNSPYLPQVIYFSDPNFPDFHSSDLIPREVKFDMLNTNQPAKPKKRPFWKFR